MNSLQDQCNFAAYMTLCESCIWQRGRRRVLRDGKPHSQRPHSFNSNNYKDHSFDYNVIQESAQQLRSLLLFSSHRVDDLLLPSELMKLKLLRVLYLSGVRFNKLPQRFGSLIHLRFLCIKDCGVKELPSSICDLPFLRTRDLRDDITNEGDCALPNALWKLKQLRHLYLNRKYHAVGGEKLTLHGLDKLETLEGIACEHMEISDLYKLKNLRYLYHAKVNGNESISKMINYIEAAKDSRVISMWIEDFHLSSDAGFVLLKKLLMNCNIYELSIHASSALCGKSQASISFVSKSPIFDLVRLRNWG